MPLTTVLSGVQPRNQCRWANNLCHVDSFGVEAMANKRSHFMWALEDVCLGAVRWCDFGMTRGPVAPFRTLRTEMPARLVDVAQWQCQNLQPLKTTTSARHMPVHFWRSFPKPNKKEHEEATNCWKWWERDPASLKTTTAAYWHPLRSPIETVSHWLTSGCAWQFVFRVTMLTQSSTPISDEVKILQSGNLYYESIVTFPYSSCHDYVLILPLRWLSSGLMTAAAPCNKAYR